MQSSNDGASRGRLATDRDAFARLGLDRPLEAPTAGDRTNPGTEALRTGARLAASTRPSALIVDDEATSRQLLEYLLVSAGFEVRTASGGRAGLRLIGVRVPELVLVDMTMPEFDGIEVTRAIRSNPRLAAVTVIMVTGRHLTADRLSGLTAGVDDYVVKPFEPSELIARVSNALRRARELRAQSPLTGLPGNSRINEEIGRRLAAAAPFAVLYADLDNFKAYNDHYGFHAGDRAIQLTASLLVDAVERSSEIGAFTGHVGGDDFVVVCRTELVIGIAAAVAEAFDRTVRELYSPGDVARGAIEVIGRDGELRAYPFMSISMGIALSGGRNYLHFSEVVKAASEQKALAKRTPGSSWAIEGDPRR